MRLCCPDLLNLFGRSHHRDPERGSEQRSGAMSSNEETTNLQPGVSSITRPPRPTRNSAVPNEEAGTVGCETHMIPHTPSCGVSNLTGEESRAPEIPESRLDTSPLLDESSTKENESPLDSSNEENVSPPSDDKFNRFIGAVEIGHLLHFQASEEIGGYDVFARAPGYGTGETDDHDEPVHGISISSPRESSPLGAAPPSDQGSTYQGGLLALADRKAEADQGWTIYEDEPSAHQHGPLEANHGVDVAQERSGDEDERRARRRQPLQELVQKNRGRRLAVVGQNGSGIQVHRISPIPFNIHKVPRPETPSVYSDSAETKGYSPTFPYSCKAALKEAYKKFVLTSSEESARGILDLSNGPHPSKVEQWLAQTHPAPSSAEEERAEQFEIWKDADRSFPKSIPVSALKDVTNFRHPAYLQFDNLVRNSAVAADMRNKIDAKRVASLRGAKKLPGGKPSEPRNVAELPEIVQVRVNIPTVPFADVDAALHDSAIPEPRAPPNSAASPATSSNGESSGDALCPPKSPASLAISSNGGSSGGAPCPPNSRASLASPSNAELSRDDDEVRVPYHGGPLPRLEAGLPKSPSPAAIAVNQATAAEGDAPPEHDSERAAKGAFALARLEGRVLPQPSSPIRRFVDPSGEYGDDVEVEFHPEFGHPKPRRWINPPALLERFHRVAESGLFDESSNIKSSSRQPNTVSGEPNTVSGEHMSD